METSDVVEIVQDSTHRSNFRYTLVGFVAGTVITAGASYAVQKVREIRARHAETSPTTPENFQPASN